MLNKKCEPLVTIHMSAYNHEDYIEEAIESIINQKYDNLEFIIINDGSKDSTHIKITNLIPICRKRFQRFEYRNRENQGLSATKNECLRWAKGKYFTGLASDDVMLPNKILDLVNLLENLDESYAIAFGDATFIDNQSNELYIDYKTGEYTTNDKGDKSFLDYFTRERDINYKDENQFGSYETLLEGNYLPAMSAVIKLEQIKEVDAWTSGNTIEDWEMWLKLSKKYKFAYIDKPVALYRWHHNNTCKVMKYELVRDSIMLLEREKEYAISKGYQSVLYATLVNLIIQLRIYNKRMLIKKLIQYSTNPLFVLQFIRKIKRSI